LIAFTVLRDRGGEYYARLHVSGKEKRVRLKTRRLEAAKAGIEEEKKAIAAARKVGWAVKKGVVAEPQMANPLRIV